MISKQIFFFCFLFFVFVFFLWKKPVLGWLVCNPEGQFLLFITRKVLKEIEKKHFHLKEQGVNYQRLPQKNNIYLYFGCWMQLKLVGENFCHPKIAIFGQKWSEITNFLNNGWRYTLLGCKIWKYRHFYPRGKNILLNISGIFHAQIFFFTHLAVKLY